MLKNKFPNDWIIKYLFDPCKWSYFFSEWNELMTFLIQLLKYLNITSIDKKGLGAEEDLYIREVRIKHFIAIVNSLLFFGSYKGVCYTNIFIMILSVFSSKKINAFNHNFN